MKEWVRIEFWAQGDVTQLTGLHAEELAKRLGLGDLFEAMDSLKLSTQHGYVASPWVKEAE